MGISRFDWISILRVTMHLPVCQCILLSMQKKCYVSKCQELKVEAIMYISHNFKIMTCYVYIFILTLS